MDILQKFLELTNRTYPHGHEQELFYLLPDNLKEDEFGNLFIKIGESDVMFTSHLDTATSTYSEVNHVIEGNIVKTDGKTLLGADDKAGVTIMLYMIENNIPGLYYFFLGEEVGCVGSKQLATKLKAEKIEGINKVISFDRRGTDSIITFQTSRRCCSDKFGQALSDELNLAESTFKYKNDPTGVLTDSVQFISIYPECTNISVGYYSEHTSMERQDIDHLTKLANACLKVNWNSLPVERDPSKVEYSNYYSNYYGYEDDWDDCYYPRNRWSGWSNRSSFDTPKTEDVWFHDAKFNYVSKIVIEKWTKKVKEVDLCPERIRFEKRIIDDLFKSIGMIYESSTWNGMRFEITYHDQSINSCTRDEVIEFLPELDYSSGDDLGGGDIWGNPVEDICFMD